MQQKTVESSIQIQNHWARLATDGVDNRNSIGRTVEEMSHLARGQSGKWIFLCAVQCCADMAAEYMSWTRGSTQPTIWAWKTIEIKFNVQRKF